MADRNLGEGYIEIRPETAGFEQELAAAIKKALAGAGIEADKAGDRIVDEFKQAAVEADKALKGIDGDGFKKLKDEADEAGKRIGDEIGAGAKQGEKAINKLAKSAGFAALSAALAKFGKASIDAFADLGESISKATVIFGENVEEIIAYGDEASKALGQSKQAAIAAASDFAIFGNAAGLTGSQLTKFSTDLTTLASDLASFSNTTPEEAVLALGAALRGESEPIRRYGVLLNEQVLKQRAVNLGLSDGKGVLSSSAKVLAAYNEIFAQTTLAQGDFARTSTSLANTQKTLKAEFENLKITIGEALAPAFSVVVEVLGDALEAFSALPTAVQGVIAGLAIGTATFAAASNALQTLGMTAKTANLALAAVTVAVTAGVVIYKAFKDAGKEAEERQLRLNEALKQAEDPTVTLISNFKDLVVQYKEIEKPASDLSDVFGDLGGGAVFVASEIGDTAPVLAQFGGDIATITAAIRGGTDEFEDLATRIDGVNSAAMTNSGVLDELTTAIEGVIDEGNPLKEVLLDLVNSGELNVKQFKDLLLVLDDLADAFDDQVEATEEEAEATLRSAGAHELFGRILGQDQYAALLANADATAEAAGRTDEWTYTLEQLKGVLEERGVWDENTGAIDANALATVGATEATDAYYTSQEYLQGALETTKDRLDAAQEAVDKYEDGLRDLFEATLASIDSGFALVDSQIKAEQAIASYEKAVGKSNMSMDEQDALARETAQSILTVAQNALRSAEDLAAANGETLTLAESQGILVGKLQEFADTLDPASPLYQYLNGFIIKIGEVPTEIPVELQAELDQAEKEFALFGQTAYQLGYDIGKGMADGLQGTLVPGVEKSAAEVRRILESTFGSPIATGQYRWGVRVDAEIGSGVRAPTSPTTGQNQLFLPPTGNWSFAEGGIFDKPQVGLFAEAGPEAIIPLSRPNRALDLLRESGLADLVLQQGGGSAVNQSFDIKLESPTQMKTARDIVREFQALQYRMTPV